MAHYAICPQCNKSFMKRGNRKYCCEACKKAHDNMEKYGNPKGKPLCLNWNFNQKECMVNEHCPYNLDTTDKDVIAQVKICEKVAAHSLGAH